MKKYKGHPRFYDLIREIISLHDRKNDNYAEAGDPLSNFRQCEQFGVPASLGAMVRMSDKWSRLVQLTKGKKDKVGESIKDTALDLAIYLLLFVVLMEEESERKLRK